MESCSNQKIVKQIKIYFYTVGKSFLIKLVDRMTALHGLGIKAKGGYFEASQI